MKTPEQFKQEGWNITAMSVDGNGMVVSCIARWRRGPFHYIAWNHEFKVYDQRAI